MSNPELPTTVLAPDKHPFPPQWPALLIPCATPSLLRDEVTEAALLPCDRCLSEQELGEGGNRTDGVRFSSPSPRSPGPAAPVGFGNQKKKKIKPVFNEAAWPSVMHSQYIVTRENPAAKIQTRISESEQGESGEDSEKDKGPITVNLDCGHHISLT